MATDPASRGANALVAANNLIYALTDAGMSIYARPLPWLRARLPPAGGLPLYPNPARDQVYVPQQAPSSSVSVYDATGRWAPAGRPLPGAHEHSQWQAAN